MSTAIPIVAIGGFWLFLIILVVFHYSAKVRRNSGASLPHLADVFGPGGGGGQGQDNGELLDELRRMEDRVRTLERILDADHPGWRSKL